MPTYEYACRSCNEVFEVFQSMRDAPLSTCPKCGKSEVKRLIGRGAGIIFRGSGFYETDYKRPAKKETAGAEKGGSESSKTETKSPPAATSSAAPSAGGAKAPGKNV